MNAIILAAGFGTRMGELTATVAKPMLPVGGKPVVERLADDLFATKQISRVCVITNGHYFEQFRKWADEYRGGEILLVNNKVLTNETRLGAIADMNMAVEHIGRDEPCLIMAGDNLFEFDFSEIIAAQKKLDSDVVAAYRQPDIEKLRKTGVASIDDENRIVRFQEKPPEPESDIAIPCLYIFTPDTLKKIPDYLATGANPDAAGHFVKWMSERVAVRAHIFSERLHSIGDPTSYEKARKAFEGDS